MAKKECMCIKCRHLGGEEKRGKSEERLFNCLKVPGGTIPENSLDKDIYCRYFIPKDNGSTRKVLENEI